MGVNISAKFTKNDALYNGLDSIAEQLHDEVEKNPGVVHTAVISYRVKFGKRDYENGGAENLTIRILEVEPLEDAALADEAKRLQRKAFQARTGNPMQEDLFSSQDREPDEDDAPPLLDDAAAADITAAANEAARQPGSRAARKHLFSEGAAK